MDVEDFDPGGGGPTGIGEILQSGSAGVVSFQAKDVGAELPDGAGPEQLSTQSRTTARRGVAGAVGRVGMGIFPVGGGNGGSGLRVDCGLRHEEAEYGCTIYCNTTDSGPL